MGLYIYLSTGELFYAITQLKSLGWRFNGSSMTAYRNDESIRFDSSEVDISHLRGARYSTVYNLYRIKCYEARDLLLRDIKIGTLKIGDKESIFRLGENNE